MNREEPVRELQQPDQPSPESTGHILARLGQSELAEGLRKQTVESTRYGLTPTQIFLRNAMVVEMEMANKVDLDQITSPYEQVKERKDLLRFGATEDLSESPLKPFKYSVNGAEYIAQNSGLEGFIFTTRKLEEHFGKEALLHHVDDFTQYVEKLFSGSSWSELAQSTIAEYKLSEALPEKKYDYLMNFATDYTRALRSLVRNEDPSFWMHDTKIYQFFPRQYDLYARRESLGLTGPETGKFFADITRDDICTIKHLGADKGFSFDTFWTMGIYPIGEAGRLGTDGGSPFAIQDYLGINPDFGTPADFARFVKLCHEEGVKVMIDFVPNHTSMDSALLHEDPTLFIHKIAASEHEPVPEGHFEFKKGDIRYFISHGAFDSNGNVSYFRDTAQLDYSNPRTRKKMIQIVNQLVDLYQIDGFRNDMAYGITNEYFGRNHRCAEKLEGQPEFLKELFESVKSRHPHIATTNEGYDLWDEMTRAGCDSIYGKNDMNRKDGYQHTGYYDALVSRNPSKLKEALLRAEFLLWQVGGASALMFDGNHDEPAPARQFGEGFWQGPALMTFMLPGSTLLQAGQEVGNDQAEPELEMDRKPLPFRKPVKIDWNNPEEHISSYYDALKPIAHMIHDEMQFDRMRVLHEHFYSHTQWVGFQLTDQNMENAGYAVIWNPLDQEIEYSMNYRGDTPPSGLIQGQLQPGGCAILDLASGLRVFLWDGENVQSLFNN
jgi:glycosidase